MNVRHHDSIKQLKKEMRLKVNLEARDRIRAVILAMKGHSSAEIADRLDHARSWVNRWVGRYSEQGWAGLWNLAQVGQPKKLSEEDQEEFERIVRRGPLSEEGLSRYRVKDLQKVLKKEFNAKYSISGIKKMLHRLGFSSIKPRPRHPQNDPVAMVLWKKEAKNFVKRVKKNIPKRKSKSGSKMKVGMARKEF